MNGQGPNIQPGFPDRSRPQRPKFNFNSKNVKKEITSDFMAAQLASFGSSAKLKSLPNQQQSDPSKQQQQQQMGPGFGQGFGPGFPQINQGFRQPVMPQMTFQGQAFMQPQMQYNMQGMSAGMQNMPMAMQGQFSTGPSNIGFNMTTSQPTSFVTPAQPQVAPFSMPTQPQAASFSMPAQPQAASFAMPAQSQPNMSFSSSSSFQGSSDVFNTFNQAQVPNKTSSASNYDPFSNLRGSNSSPKQEKASGDVFKSSSTFPTQPVAKQQEFDAFGAKPFATNDIASSNHAATNVSQSGMFSAFDNLSAFSSNSSSSVPSSTTPKPPAASVAPNIGEFPGFGTSMSHSQATPVSISSSALDSMFGPHEMSSGPKSSGFESSFPTPATTTVKPVSQFESSFNPTLVAQKSGTTFDSVFSSSQPSLNPPNSAPTTVKPVSQFESSFNPTSAAPTSGPMFDSVFLSSQPSVNPPRSDTSYEDVFSSSKPAKAPALTSTAPSNQNFGFESSFEPAPLSATAISSSAFDSTPNSFNAFDDDFAAIATKRGSVASLSSKSTAVPDSFGQMPFSMPTSTTDMFGTPSSSATAEISAVGLKFPETAQSASVTKTQQPHSLDMFDAAPFNVETGGSMKASQPSSVGVVDKYSVFSALNSDFSSADPSLELNKPDLSFQTEPIQSKPVPQTIPEAPVQTFQGTDMFDDSFDPFNEKKAPPAAPTQTNFDQFDMFAQLSTSKTQEVKTPEVKSQEIPPPNSTGSIARQRPSSKTPGMMVVLTPPAKATDRKKPSKPAPPTITAPASSTVRPSASMSSNVFDPFFHSSGGLSVETDGAVFAKPARPAAPAPSNQRLTATKTGQVTSQVATKPAPRRAKRRAPPPPTKQPGSASQSTFYAGEKKEAVLSLLDLDFSTSAPAVPSSSGAPPPQPLLILPTADIMSKGAPPSRPPPPKSGDDTAAMIPTFEGTLPPLPPRPGPGHILYHHVLKTGPFCVALFEFEAENDDELDFKAGDGIKLDSDISDEWFAGSIGNRRGIFPKNCVEVKIPLPAKPRTPAEASWSSPSFAPISKPTSSPVPTPSPVLAPSPVPSPSPVPDPIDWGTGAGPKPETAPQKDILNAWGDSRTPSPPPNISSEPVPTVTPSPEPAVKREEVTPPEPELNPIGTCVAIYSFEAQESDELTINEGETIDVLEFVDDDWIKGKVGDKVGIFPRSYASFGDDEIEEELEEILDEVTHSVNVFYDFEAGADDELSLSAGDMVKVISTVGDEWIKGRFEGKEGIFPACFVPAIPDHWNIPEDTETFTENFETTEESSSSSSSSSSSDEKERMSEISDSRSYSAEPTSDLGRVQMIADFEAENDFEMSVKTGDIVTITAKLNELWLEGECNGNTGILPVNFVKWLDAAPEPDIIGNPAVMDRAELERQDTIKSSDEPKQAAQTSAPPSAGFSECNPFAQEFDKGTQPLAQDMFTGDLPPPPAQEDLDKTLVNTENPFTVDMVADQVTPVSSTPTIQPGIKPGDKRRALYEFTSVNDDELDFNQGDEIEVTEFLNDDWLRGKCKGKEGLFPTSFTEEAHQS